MVNKNNGVGRLIPGIRYSVGLNDGKEFRRACYVGTKLLNGKPMMCFRTVEDVDLTVNLTLKKDKGGN